MKSTEVNALVSTLRSDASPQIAGFLYQFVMALDYCFQLAPGQSLYIEKYGDVAIKGDGSFDGETTDTSVEVKMYADNLDVKHHNLLNTLSNWLENDFDFESYQTLVIYTTQPFSKKSTLIGWERKSPAQRLKCVWDAYSKYLKDNQSKIEDKDSSKHASIKENARQMSRVLGSVVDDRGKVDEIASRERLQDLLSRVCIIDSCQNLQSRKRMGCPLVGCGRLYRHLCLFQSGRAAGRQPGKHDGWLEDRGRSIYQASSNIG